MASSLRAVCGPAIPVAMRASLVLLALLTVSACSSDKNKDMDDDLPTDDAGVTAATDAGTENLRHACGRAPIDRTLATSMYEAMRCLFEGKDAPQQVVAPGTISPERIAVARGRVLDQDGKPLPGVHVRIADHAELGQVVTGDDGTYDLALNGGGLITLRFERDGCLPAQRRERTEWREFATLDDVTLLSESPVVNAIDLAAPTGSFARGEPIADQSGERRQDVFVRPGTRATMTLPDGRKQTLTSFHLRVTEYTRGERGPSAMPGELPATSGYTYASSFSLDEARAAGATRVEFEPPVIGYVDNFLKFPVGTVVPNGYYDEKKAAWEAGPNGVVVQVVAQADGKLGLDADGDGKADAPSAMGISAEENAALAQNLEAGATYWRVPLPHFSPWDHNWGVSPPSDAEGPKAGVASTRPSECNTSASGSIIGCESQTLGEILPVSGTPFTLHYQSERMPGRLDQTQLEIPLTSATYPASLKRVDLEIEVLGKQTKLSVPPSPNARHLFRWDGLDAYGRRWQGRQTVQVRIGYVYDGVYAATSRFGAPANGVAITGDRARQELTLWTQWRGQIGTFESLATGLGGWTLSAHHVYDARGGVIEQGDGQRRSRERIGAVITTIAGNGKSGFAGDSGPATEAQIANPHGVAIAPDGTVFFSEDSNHRIRKIAPDGVITTFAGNGMAKYAGDGGRATDASLNRPMGLALAPDGTLYIADGINRVVRAVAPDGTIRTVAGGGKATVKPGQTVLARDAQLVEPHALARGEDGVLYIADNEGLCIYRLDVDGTLGILAGGGSRLTDGPVMDSKIGSALGLALDREGNLYFTDYDNHRVRKIDKSGMITTVAGTGSSGFAGDGGPADLAKLSQPHTVDVAADGSLYITDEGNGRVRRVAPDGYIETIAGGGSPADGVGDNGPPESARFSLPRVVYVHKDGSLWVADHAGGRVRRLRPSLPGYANGEIALASASGDQIFVFDALGKHLRTIDALTQGTLWTFGYDAAGRLSSLRDAALNETRIERAADGKVTAIVGPYGERTELELDGDGYLASLTNAAKETTALTYRAGGLLASLGEPRDPSKEVHRFEYDEIGRLVRDTSPSGLDQTLVRTQDDKGYTVELRTKLGRSTKHRVESKGKGVELRTVTRNDERPTTAELRPSGYTRTSPAGTVETVTLAADPRFGMQAPYVASSSVKFGARSALVTTRKRTAKLRDTSDPTSVLEVREEVTTPSGTTSEVWDVAARTRTRTTAAGRTLSERWDERGRIVESKVGSLAPETYAYDERNRLTRVSRGDRSRSYAYDATGRVGTRSDALLRTWSTRRQAAGRVLEHVLPDQTVVKLGYDPNGNVTSVTPPERPSHLFEYGLGDLLQRYTPANPGKPVSTTYDEDARPSVVTRADGRSVVTRYDVAGRPIEIGHPDDVIERTYVASTGQLASVVTKQQTLTLGYEGELPTSLRFSGIVTGEVSFGYDAQLRLGSERVGSASVSFSYDADDLLLKAGEQTLGYDPNGLLTTLQLGALRESWERDLYGEATRYTVTGATPLYGVENVRRDALGRLVAFTERVGTASHTHEFRYHPRGWLIEALLDGASTKYSYDQNGNRTAVTGANGTVSASYDAQDRIVARGDTRYVFGDDGQLLDKTGPAGVTRYAYDALGTLRNVTLPDGRALEYVVDGLSRRLGKKRDGKLVQGFLYRDQLRPVAELDASGAVIARFVYASQASVPDQVIKGGVTYRLIKDVRGSIRLVLNAQTGEIAQELSYDAFGRVLSDSKPGFQPFGFAGGLYDTDTGLVRFGARDYDAEAGRWTSRDPILFRGGQANLYVYAANDPINQRDPRGTQAIAPALPVAGGFAAADGPFPFGDAIGICIIVGAGIRDLITLATDGTPRNNQAQNKQFADAVKKIEREIGRRLSKDEIRRLHDEITGQDFGFDEIVEEGLGLFDDAEGD